MRLFELQSTAELTELEQQLDKMFASLGLDVEFSRHFKERLLGRERNVSVEEIIHSFDQLKSKYKSRLLKAKRQNRYSAVLRDFDQDLNIVFGIQQQADGDHELVNITIRKKDPSTFVTSQAGGDNLRIGSKKTFKEDSIPAVMSSGINPLQTADDHDEKAQGHDTANNEREKILKVGRGENHKTAKRIASIARTKARATNKDKAPPPDEEVIQGADDTPHTTTSGIDHNQMRLGK
jgi:hypothetical protein